jgi:DNA replication protein
MVNRFRLPYTEKQTYTMLYAACRAEVANRYRKFRDTESYKERLSDIAKWLTGNSSTFGLYLCGGAGNGKTTILKALQNLLEYLRSNERTDYDRQDLPQKGFILITAKELVLLAKAYNNPTNDNKNEVTKYKRIRDIEILAIDDLGTEPRESIHYGDIVTATMDMISYRYEKQFCTLVSSNLAANEITQYYDERIADRFREMMHIVNFGMEQSFRI